MSITTDFEQYGRRDRQYYFAYGSNMNPGQMAGRCATPRVVCAACLSGYRLGFYGRNRVWDGGLESVVEQPGGAVWGVLYELTFSDAASLDIWCGARLDGGGSYFHYPVLVVDSLGRNHAAVLYKKDVRGPAVLPSREYLGHIAAGAKAHALPAEYMLRLENTESQPARYAVPRRENLPGGILHEATCAECAG